MPGQQDVGLLLPDAEEYWTQHTEGCGLDFWHGAVGTKKSERGVLGHWEASGSQGRYMRTPLCIIEKFQFAAAKEAVLPAAVRRF